MKKKNDGDAERFFREFGKRVDQFVEDLDQANDRLRKDFKNKYEDLKKSGERMKKEVTDKERWKEVDHALKKGMKELEKALDAAFKKRSKK